MNQHDSSSEHNRLNDNYHRRAKVAAWASAISFGVLVGEQAASAQSSTAAPAAAEKADRAERGPKAFISHVDQELGSLLGQLKSSHNLHVVNGSDFVKDSKDKIYYINMPSKSKRGHYDWLVMSTRQGQKVPLGAAVTLGADSNVFNGYKHSSLLLALTHSNNKGAFTPGFTALSSISDPNHASTYSVSTVEKEFQPHFGKWTSQTAQDAEPTKSVSEAMVAAQYTNFFNKAEQVLEAN